MLLILALLASIAAPRVTKYLRKAKSETAKIQIHALSAALDSYQLDTGKYPTTDVGLKALIERSSDATNWDGPYITKRDSLTDPWGKPYLYRYPGQHGEYDVYTLGSDQKEGGEGDAQDVGNW